MEPSNGDNVRPFEDAALAYAVRRAWGDEHAPAALRERIERVAAASRAAGVFPPIEFAQQADAPHAIQASHADDAAAASRRRGVWRRFAAAALLLVAIGGGIVRYVTTDDAPAQLGAVIPAGFASALSTTHDTCLRFGDAHQSADLPAGDMGQVASALRAKLNRPVLAATPAGVGWHFHGARICAVNGHEGAHLLFVNGPAAVSIFSFSAAACEACGGADLCESTTAGHAIAGFAQGGGLFCIVTSSTDGTVTLARARAIRDALRPQVTAGIATPGGRAVARAN